MVSASRGLLAASLLFAGASAEATESETGPFVFRDMERVLAHNQAQNLDTAEHHAGLGWLLSELGRPKESLEAFRKAAERSPGDASIAAGYGRAAFNLGRPEAHSAVTTALAIDPAHPAALRAAGEMALETGEPAQAVETLSSLVERNPQSAHARFLLGQAHEENGSRDRAVEDYGRAVTADAQYVEIRSRMAAALSLLGKKDEAWVEFSKVESFDPQHGNAARQREVLESLLTRPKEDLMAVGKLSAHAVVEPAPGAQAMPVLRIGLSANMKGVPAAHTRVTVRLDGEFEILDTATGRKLAEGEGNEPWTFETGAATGTLKFSGGGKQIAAQVPRGIRIRTNRTATLIVDGIIFGQGASWEGRADRELRGALELRWTADGRGFFLVNVVSFEEYLYGVLASEMPPHWPMEALKTQAVVARTEAAFRRAARPHRALDFDLCDEQHCQAYGGVKSETPKTREAVDSTRGEILKYSGRIAHTVYFSNCGGRAQAGEDIGWGKTTYWKAASDIISGWFPGTPWEFREWILASTPSYCEPGRWSKPSHFRWTRAVSVKDIERRLSKKHSTGKIADVAVVSRGPAGHVLKLNVTGAKGSVTLRRENEIRRALGLAPLRSTLFILEKKYRDGGLTEITIHGAGWGHMVGLCQSGAAGRAQEGHSYQDILNHYYPGTALARDLYN